MLQEQFFWCKAKKIAATTAEAELIFVVEASKQAIRLSEKLEDLGVSFKIFSIMWLVLFEASLICVIEKLKNLLDNSILSKNW